MFYFHTGSHVDYNMLHTGRLRCALTHTLCIRFFSSDFKWESGKKRRDSGGPAGDHYVHNVGAAELQLYKHYSILYMCTIIEDKTAFLCGLFKAWHRMGQWWYARNSMRGRGLVQYGIVVYSIARYEAWYNMV